jgi:hypothetical protein
MAAPLVLKWSIHSRNIIRNLVYLTQWLTRKEPTMKSVLQDWVMNMGLRHQGTLLSGIRGCDTVAKNHPTKIIIRGLRADCLNAHNGDPTKALTFIKPMPPEEFHDYLPTVLDSLDELPSHYLSHFMHSVQIVAFYHEDMNRRSLWNMLYLRICKRLHLHPETPADVDRRLNAPEVSFAQQEDEV